VPSIKYARAARALDVQRRRGGLFSCPVRRRYVQAMARAVVAVHLRLRARDHTSRSFVIFNSMILKPLTAVEVRDVYVRTGGVKCALGGRNKYILHALCGCNVRGRKRMRTPMGGGAISSMEFGAFSVDVVAII
jgi:hypothetical protein